MEDVEILIDYESMKTKIIEIAKAISKDYQGEEVVMVCVLKGAMHFYTQLCEKIEGVNIIESIVRVVSYGDKTETNCTPVIEYESNEDIKGKNVILVEDIIDSGFSLATLKRHYEEKGAIEVSVAVMLDKPSRRKDFTVTPKYTGFKINDLFVVGMGLDYQEKYRSLPYIGVPRSELKRAIDLDRGEIKAQIGESVRQPKEGPIKEIRP